jgi:putative DNA primase/helicase
VPRFDISLLPAELRGWIHDIAERGSFPIEYVAVSAMVAISSVVGRQCGIKPKEHDDWLVSPNLWGMIVGKPGVFKSPALAEALKPLHRLETTARDKYKEELSYFEAQKQVSEALAKAAKSKLESEAKSGKASQEALLALAKQTTPPDSDKPTCTRYVANDVSSEKLQEMLGENPNGIMLLRDELSGLLKSLDKQGHENDRAFYLECWDGTRGYTSDRIGRGTTYCDAACLSMLGTIQRGTVQTSQRATTAIPRTVLCPAFN